MYFITSRVSRRANIFGSIRLCVCLSVLWTYGPNIWRTHWGPSYLGRVWRSRSPRSKRKRILVFSLVSEKVVLSQGHEGQGRRSKVARVMVIVQGHMVKVRFVRGELSTPSTRRRRDMRVFSCFKCFCQKCFTTEQNCENVFMFLALNYHLDTNSGVKFANLQVLVL